MTSHFDEIPCKTHPDAPHGFDRNASISEDRYVCECESWEPPSEPVYASDISQECVDETAKYKHEPKCIGIIGNWGKVEWCDGVFPQLGDRLYTAPPKRDLTCVCGAVWDGEQMVHAPPKREWVGLTEDEKQFFKAMGFSGIDIVEAKLKEKNS